MKQTLWCCVVCILCVVYFCPDTAAGDTDPVDEVLKQKPRNMDKPEKIEYVRQLISNNSSHPRILELRFFAARQLMGEKHADFRSIINKIEQIAKEAGEEADLNFECRIRIGRIHFHILKDPKAAYQNYKSLEHHPTLLKKNDLQTDYKRVNLYKLIAEAAAPNEVNDKDEVEKYCRLVMAYPHLGMEDRKMYAKFYSLYDEAACIFVAKFSHNIEKLQSIEIFPSHPTPRRWRRDAIKSMLNERRPEPVQDQMLIDLHNDTVNISPDKADAEVSPGTPSAESSNIERSKTPHAPQSTKPVSKLWIILVMVILGGGFVSILLL